MAGTSVICCGSGSSSMFLKTAIPLSQTIDLPAPA